MTYASSLLGYPQSAQVKTLSFSVNATELRSVGSEAVWLDQILIELLLPAQFGANYLSSIFLNLHNVNYSCAYLKIWLCY
jgi:hypothetical protein